MKKTLRPTGLGALACAAASLFTATPILAQGIAITPAEIQIAPDGRVTVDGQATAMEAAAEPAAGQPARPGAAAAKEKTAEDLLVEKFPALTFDRRQSIILKTWASPWPIPIPEPDPEAEELGLGGYFPSARKNSGHSSRSYL